jgi:GAF domain-containing protein
VIQLHSAQDEKRLEVLRGYHVLDTPPEEAFDRITSLAARLFNAPIVLVNLVDETRQWFKSCYGTDIRETDLSVSFCMHAIEQDEVLVVPDATRDSRFCSMRTVTGEPFVRFYAGAPLRTRDGCRLGTLCLIDTEPRPIFSTEEQATLQDLAQMVMRELEARLREQALTRATTQATTLTHRMQTVAQAATRILDVQHLDKLHEVLKEALGSIIDFDYFNFGLYDEQNHAVRYLTAYDNNILCHPGLLPWPVNPARR